MTTRRIPQELQSGLAIEASHAMRYLDNQGYTIRDLPELVTNLDAMLEMPEMGDETVTREVAYRLGIIAGAAQALRMQPRELAERVAKVLEKPSPKLRRMLVEPLAA